MENVYAAEDEAGPWQWLLGKNTTSIVLHNTDAFRCFTNDVKISNSIDQRPRNLVASAELGKEVLPFEVMCLPLTGVFASLFPQEDLMKRLSQHDLKK
ncbi:uncharacterized protein LOC132645289 isoform X3 [Lycium barbarum]|uniref:uncharacterized protein LOC132645289 isoform X3 n=1 Tax=Lycium barbarum TaxID=112863 RepID=UPI00293F1300|nr:uncharacterized protein LOC132645289 isoform X3 [Lycium barbarum]